jgi:hypothetical protein
MAYDEVIADRIRALLNDEPSLTEQRMFGGTQLSCVTSRW